MHAPAFYLSAPTLEEQKMKALTTILAMLALSVAPAMWAQQADAPQADRPAQAQAAEQTLTGCLSSQDNTFTLKTSTGDVQIEGSGLQSHVGHTIRVTGTRATTAGKATFKVTKVEMVSSTCQS